MKRIVGIVVWTCVLLALLVGALAQEETEEQTYNYQNPDTYDNPDFYQDADWSQVPPERIPDVPPERLDYSQLNADQRLQMTAEQIAANFDNIDNLMIDVDREAAREAIETTYSLEAFRFLGLTFLEHGVQIRNDVLAATFGRADHVTLSDAGYRQGSLLVWDDGSIEFQPRIFSDDETAEITIPATDRVTVYTEQRTLLYNGHGVNGWLSFDAGRLSVKRSATIDEIIIVPPETGVAIYFDGLEHEGDYFSSNREQGLIRAQSLSSATEYVFLSGNGIFEMTEESVLSLRPGHSKVLIQRRSAEGLVPFIFVQGDGMFLDNGINRYGVVAEGFTFVPGVTDEGTSVPLTLFLRDRSSNPILGTPEEEERLIFDAGNNYLVIPARFPPAATDCFACTVDLSQSLVLFDYYAAQMQAATNIQVLRATGNPLVLRRIFNYIQDLPPPLRDSIRNLHIVPDEDIERKCGENAAACVDETGRMFLGESATFEIISHEAAHTFTYESEGTLRHDFGELVEVYGSIENADPEVLASFAEEQQEFRRLADTLENHWLSNAGDVYGQSLGEEVAEHVALTWEDGSEEPRYGCFRAYGCNNWREDFATSHEPFANQDYGLVQDLIDPESGFYQERMDQEIGNTGEIMTAEVAEDWARRYRGRVEILQDYGSITEEEYQRVINP
ncbi:hypothetical protein HYS49_02420 [Candidatus Woesearchaeota archaeon]|nr:hypothetical protein [Candidatus Woesearchaeota archaeon]